MTVPRESPSWSPAYTSFKTLLNTINRMEEEGAIPPQIDRSYLRVAEGAKTQLLLSFKALGLVDQMGRVQPILTELVNNPDNRKQMIRSLLERHYAQVNMLAAQSATQKMLEDAFTEHYAVSGDTRRKAIAFYIHAAKFADLPLSPYWKSEGGGSTASAPRKQRRQAQPGANGEEDPRAPVVVQPADPRQRYLDMLMKKAETAEGDVANELLDRIERLLGYGSPQDMEGDTSDA
jgi:hypothetical protein